MISLPQTILFASGDDVINSQAIPMVEEIAGVLGAVLNRVTLSGHADSTPIHNRRFKNNWELSAARGLRLLELLSGRYGISESRLTVSSDGANRPKESNETPEGRASNRRVEILILNEP
jgi:chemotaxis protein MotB